MNSARSTNWIFQFTPLHERQRKRYRAGACVTYFNSRLYMRGNTKGGIVYDMNINFNSRLYMRGNDTGYPSGGIRTISIHAST